MSSSRRPTRPCTTQEETPQPLKDGFNAIRDVLEPVAHGRDPGTLTEVAWGALHGLVTLTRGGRLPRANQELRLAVLVEQLQAEA
jgi:hypothetical protein